MKKTLALLMLIIYPFILFGQTWTKENTKAFQKSKQIAFTMDMTNIKIWGFTKDKFYTYYKQKNDVSDELIDILFEKFYGIMTETLSNKSDKKIVGVDSARFELVYHINQITENAGYSGYFYVVDHQNDCSTNAGLSFYCEDGRWNTFDKLLLENAEKGILRMTSRCSPFKFPFHKYQKK